MIVDVAVGVIFNPQGEVLLAKRPPHVHQGNLWEFPGGKLKPGESAYQALCRELEEELGIHVLQARPLLQVRHEYPAQSVLLHIWRVERFSGIAWGQEGQPVAWTRSEDLNAYSLLAASRPIVTALRLPSTYLITGASAENQEMFLHRLRLSLQSGVRLVQLRVKELNRLSFLALAQEAQHLCFEYGAIFLVNTSPDQAVELNADGVHLTSKRLMALSQRPLASHLWVAASCHSAAQLSHAAQIGVDFAVLGPIFATPSHSDALPLGWDQFQALVELASIPVYALGGVGLEQLESAWHFGGQGIAAIRALWGDISKRQRDIATSGKIKD